VTTFNGHWVDAGTFDALLDAANWAKEFKNGK
jgi:hypothetical protein